MSLRHKAREFALQMLFQWAMSAAEPSTLEEGFWKGAQAAKPVREFANWLFEGAVAEVAATDHLLAKNVHNWRLERVAAIDHNILRLAVYELRCGDAPPKVVLDEALELAKKFSSTESVAFINGVLDAVLQQEKRTSKRETRKAKGEPHNS